MYLPAQFREEDISALHAAMRAAGLVTLAVAGPEGLDAAHVPMLLDSEPGPFGTLRGHVARANPIWKTPAEGAQALAIFLGPDAYVTPSWYETKRQTGKVVPTWNYVAIHARGRVRFFDDADRLLAIVTALTERQEGVRRNPWAVTDAPADFVASMLKAIVGFELAIAKLDGKWKMSQNRPAEDRAGVIAGLRAETAPVAAEVADLVAQADAKLRQG